MRKSISNVSTMIKVVRSNWLNVQHATSAVPGAEPKFSAQGSMRKDSDQAQHILAIQDQIGESVWQDKWPQVKRQLEAQDRLALRDGDIKGGSLEDHYYFNASNKARPLVLNRDRTPLAEEDGVLYNGCYVNMKVEFWAQNHAQYGKRINAKLLGIQFAKDGEPFTPGSVASVNEFEVITDNDDAAMGLA